MSKAAENEFVDQYKLLSAYVFKNKLNYHRVFILFQLKYN